MRKNYIIYLSEKMQNLPKDTIYINLINALLINMTTKKMWILKSEQQPNKNKAVLIKSIFFIQTASEVLKYIYILME